MLQNLIAALSLITLVNTTLPKHMPKVLAKHVLPMNDRYGNEFVNNVFKDNILLTMAYLDGRQRDSSPIDWQNVEQTFHYQLILQPFQTFAFHDSVLPQFVGKISYTTNSHFNSIEGFKSDGYLVGDGVCHLASVINWVAKDAGLAVLAPTPHNFAVIPDVPKEYGTAIYDNQDSLESSALQNLYVTNDKPESIALSFDYDGNTLTVEAIQE